MWNSEDEDQEAGERVSLHQNDNHERPRSPWFLLPVASCVASLGGILFGYDIGIISGAMLLLKTEFQLSCQQQELIVTSLLIGGLIASIVGGQLLDRYGRKITIIINAGLFFAGALVLTFSKSFPVFIIGRVVVGFAVSLSAIGDCVYISEIAPANKRGLLVSLNELGITIGLLFAYLVNFLLINVSQGWKYMFGISAIPAVLQALGMLFLPASPRWLITMGKEARAKTLIASLWPEKDSNKEMSRLKATLSSEKSYSFTDLFRKKENLRMRMFVGCGIVLFQQLTGQPTVLYYAPVLFKTLGFNKNASATLATVGLGVVKVVFTFLTLCTVDKLGRRTFLLLGAIIMTISVVILAAVTEPLNKIEKGPQCGDMAGTQKLHFHLLHPKVCTNTTQINSTSNLNIDIKNKNIFSTSVAMKNENCSATENDETIKTQVPGAVKYTCFIALMLFVIGYAVGYGPMSWLLLTEIFPTGIKGRAVAAASIVNWGTNIVVSMTFLEVIGSIGPFWTFLTYALIGVVAIFFICHFVPETKGKSLELVSAELNQGTFHCTVIRCCAEGHVLLVEDDEQDILLRGDDWITNDVEDAL